MPNMWWWGVGKKLNHAANLSRPYFEVRVSPVHKQEDIRFYKFCTTPKISIERQTQRNADLVFVRDVSLSQTKPCQTTRKHKKGYAKNDEILLCT
jgi:hypothetical protein